MTPLAESIGTVPNQPKTPMLSVRIPTTLRESVKAEAKRRGETVTDVVRRAFELYVSKYADVPNEGWCYSCGDLAQGDDVAPIVYRLRAQVAAVEALLDAEEERVRLANERFAARGEIEPKSGTPLRIAGIVPVTQIRAALDGESS